MNDEIPVVVRMRVECGHAEDESYKFDMPIGRTEPLVEYVSVKCPECGAAVKMNLNLTVQ